MTGENDPQFGSNLQMDSSARSSKVDLRGKRRASISLQLPGPLNSNLSSSGDTSKSKKEAVSTKS